MELKDIVESQAKFVRNSGVTVEVTRNMPWVDIKDNEGGEVFLQGDDAETFVTNLDELSDKLPDVDFETIELACAYDYIHLLTE